MCIGRKIDKHSNKANDTIMYSILHFLKKDWIGPMKKYYSLKNLELDKRLG